VILSEASHHRTTKPLDRGGSRVEIVDAMRGFAALSVAIYHARNEFWIGLARTWNLHGVHGNLDTWLGYMSAPFSFGGLGVPLFFVLSGYCIHRGYAKRLTEDSSFSARWPLFLVRRFFRIYPVYICALLLTALVDHVHTSLSGPLQQADNSPETFLASVLALQGIAAPMFGTNSVFWTLSVEIHLYLFYPLLFAVTRRHGPIAMLGVAFAISAAYICAHSILRLEEWLPYAHGIVPVFLAFVFMWSVGAFIAECEVGRHQMPRRPWLVLIWIPSLVAGVAAPNLLGCLFLGVGIGGLAWYLLRVGLTGNRQIRLLVRCLGWVGIGSYSLYAVHRPIFELLKIAGFDGQVDSILLALLATLVAVLASRLFFILIETPSLEAASRWRQ
jgi:peptidoglycan/LPS O-acetylase OafA/YrhL